MSVRLAPGPNQTLWDCLGDCERENVKLRRELVKRTCDCKPMVLSLPLDEKKHGQTCRYRLCMEKL